MSFEVLAEQQLALSTKVALFTQFGIVRRHFVADAETLHSATDLDNDAGGLVARNHRHVRLEVAVCRRQICSCTCASTSTCWHSQLYTLAILTMDVQIRSAYTTRLYYSMPINVMVSRKLGGSTFDEDLMGSRLRHRDLNQFEVFGFVVTDGFHVRRNSHVAHLSNIVDDDSWLTVLRLMRDLAILLLSTSATLGETRFMIESC